MTDMPQPRTAFEWPVYADATLAGLSVLIPIPLVDWVFEQFFRRRIPGAIARYRDQRLPPPVISILNTSGEGCARTCLTLPFWAVVMLIKRLSRKILYFLTIKEASDELSRYLHRAFLIDYMLLAGHLEDESSARIAQEAMERVIAEESTSPLNQLAEQITHSTRRIFRSLRRARRGEEDGMIREKKTILAGRWSELDGYLKNLAARYYETYRRLKAQPESV